MKSYSEQATLSFYHWESRASGYLLFDDPVELEPPFAQLEIQPQSSCYIDDGKVPSLLQKAHNLFKGEDATENENDEFDDVEPHYDLSKKKRRAFVFSFPYNQEIDVVSSQDFLNLLCYSQEAFSFEIIAQEGKIEFMFTATVDDAGRLLSQLKGFFPSVIIQECELYDMAFELDRAIAIADFAPEKEFMLPIGTSQNFSKDPLTSVIATLESISPEETVVFQILFKGAMAPWQDTILYASGDGRGGSFFQDAPEFILGAKEKVSETLFAVVMRMACQGTDDNASNYLGQQLSQSILTISVSEYNRLVPLSNKGYDYDNHLENLFKRKSHRLGFLLNTKELSQFVHHPNKSVVSAKIGLAKQRSKQAPILNSGGIYIGENIHNRESLPVYLDEEIRLSHCMILGATGTGKSTLLATMMLADIESGKGAALFDSHGDICLDILKRIPEHRKKDVIIIDPSDAEFPIGFNLLEANSDAEKIVLSSDLVSSFKRHSSAWGDNMTAVLSNVIATILESSKGGTLIELKRFLIEEKFRKEYLLTVEDPSLHYYWHNEYPMMRKGITPLLTRIDTFLRPKLVRYMLAQKQGIDIAQCIEENKIMLLMFSQGLIGESNSFLLSSLFLAKFNQAALARQTINKEDRRPYFLYLDEYQHYITPSIEKILSGARKYGLGLTIANQELGQIQDAQLLNSVLANPKTRICFRLGDSDARKLASGFSYFEDTDLLNLARGETIVRIGSSQNDFNLSTRKLDEDETPFSDFIINNTRNNYAQSKDAVESLLYSMLPQVNKVEKPSVINNPDKQPVLENTDNSNEPEVEIINHSSFEKQKADLLEKEEQREQESKHRAIQNYVLSLGQQRNFITQLEVETQDQGRIDVVLQKENLKIAVEVSVTNTTDYEVQNIMKCLNEKMTHVFIISESKVHLANIKKKAKEALEKAAFKKLGFGTPAQFLTYLDNFEPKVKKEIKRVRGYRVKTNHVDLKDGDANSRNQKIQDIIMKRKKDTR